MKKTVLWTTIATTAAAAVMVVQPTPSAEAATVTQNAARNGIVSITDLTIPDYGTYDVTFPVGTFSSIFGTPGQPGFQQPAFWQNRAGADAAAGAIVNALNAVAPAPTNYPLGGLYYYIPYDVTSAASVQYFSIRGQALTWQAATWVSPGSLAGQPVAVLTQVAAPAIPTPALLPGILGLGIATLTRKLDSAESA
jgi:hypothetical protein